MNITKNTKLLLSLFSLLISSSLFAIEPGGEQPDPQELENKISELYQQINPEGLSKEIFKIAYLGYVRFSKNGVQVDNNDGKGRHEEQLGSKALLTVVDFSQPSGNKRMYVMDISQSPKMILNTVVSHGYGSGRGAMATSFGNYYDASNPNGGTGKSSRMFYVTSVQYDSTRVGYALKLNGQNSGTNHNLFPRGVVLHRGKYVTYARAESGRVGNSAGCLAVPTEHNRMLVDLLEHRTVIYAHTSENSTDSEIKPEDVRSAEEAANQRSSSPNVPAGGPAPVTYENTSEFDEVRNQKTIGSQNGTNSVPLLGGDGSPTSLATLDTEPLSPAPENPTPDKQGFASLNGTEGFETCQNLASEPWCSIVKKVEGGADPHQFFEASWNDVENKIVYGDDIEDWKAQNMAENNLGMIRECAAMVHLTDKTDCEKKEINKDDKRVSKDGAIECKYLGPESQDYKHCVSTVDGYEGLLDEEKKQEERQGVQFNTLGAAVTSDLKKSGDAQTDALTKQQTLIGAQANIANERGNLSMAKARYLQSALGKFPTRQSRLDQCQSKYKKHNNGGVRLYKAYVRQFTSDPKVPILPDPCNQAMRRMNPNLIHNVKARTQIKKAVEKAGLVAEDYYDKQNTLEGNKGKISNAKSNYKIDELDIEKHRNDFKCGSDEDCFGKSKNDIDKPRKVGLRNSKSKDRNSKSSFKNSSNESARRKLRERRRIKNRNGSGIHKEDLYVVMDKALTYPNRRNLKRIEPEVDEFGRYYDYKDRLGVVSKRAKVKIEPFLAGFGIETRNSRKKYSNKISGKRDLWYKKDGTLFEFDINKKKDLNLFDIITNRYKSKFKD
ncbi:MAG: murein L,D-transpeptidase catalytic domain family protein [Bacteriovoracaceae bacterium]|nr:murein L,D-transpeptidase catalytic domain family protein [Bacteriovoracaceae bacterium]